MSDINITVNDEIVNIDVIDEPVLVNVVNSPGQQGPAGPGVPVGGTAGQILAKASATDYDTEWINNYAKYLATNVRNQTGSTIGAFQVVYISGATGNKPLISLADADTEVTSSKTYGVTATSIANNGTGDVVTAGELSGIDTSAFNEGDLLWLSTTAGGVVTTPPAEPAHAVFIGYVVRSHPTLGTIDVSIQNGYELNELHGVQITTPTDNQGLFYNSTSTLWENKTISTALGYTPVPTTRNITINGVTYDLSADRTWTISTGISGSGAAGQVTYWTGSSAVSGSNNLFWDNTNGRLGIGTNVPAYPLHITRSSGSYVAPLWVENTGSASIDFKNVAVFVGARGNASNIDDNTNIGIWQKSNIVGNYGVVNFFNSSGNLTAFLGAEYSVHTTNQTGNLIFGTVNAGTVAVKAKLFNTGNLVLQNGGTFTDGGQRLQVIGDTLLRGSGNTSATTALSVQNSSSQNIITIKNNRTSNIISDAGQLNIASSADGTNGLMEFDANSSNTQTVFVQLTRGTVGFASTAINQTAVRINGGFAPTSGTATWHSLHVNPTINQTGGANGITRGLYVNPTLTAAADFRAIETSAGNVLFGSNFFWDNANGRLGIGTNAPAVQFHLNTTTAGNNFRISGANNTSVNFTTDTDGRSFLNVNGNTSATATAGAYFTAQGFQEAWFNVIANGANAGNKYWRFGNVGVGTLNNVFAIQKLNDAGNAISLTPFVINSTNGFVGINNTAPSVQLSVSGDTLLRGSGATSATTALTVQNSSSTNLFTVRNDGLSTFGGKIVANGSTTSQSGLDVGTLRFQFFATNNAFIAENSFYNGSAFQRVNTGLSSVFYFAGGGFQVGTMPTGTAGTTQTNLNQRMYLTNEGTLAISDTISGGGNITLVASAVLQTDSTTKGFLPPRMTTTQKNAIATPAAGLVVYDTTLNKLCVYTTAWETITSI